MFNIKTLTSVVLVCSGLISSIGFAEVQHKVGKAAAARYFQNERLNEKRSLASSGEGSTSSSQSTLHYMSLGFGTFSSSQAYNWGNPNDNTKVGRWGVDLSYRFEEQEYLFDQMLRINYTEYLPDDKEATKLSFLYSIVMPEAGSQFPLYFGAAGGLGVFMKQLQAESLLSLDYQLYLGLRTFNVFDKVGFYIEGGLRNHFHLLSDGQFNGTFLSLGSVFTF